MYLVLITGFKSIFVILKNMSKNNRSKSQEAHLGSDSPAPTLLDQQADQPGWGVAIERSIFLAGVFLPPTLGLGQHASRGRNVMRLCLKRFHMQQTPGELLARARWGARDQPSLRIP
jgi:hypothetical protein